MTAIWRPQCCFFVAISLNWTLLQRAVFTRKEIIVQSFMGSLISTLNLRGWTDLAKTLSGENIVYDFEKEDKLLKT